MTDEKAFGAIQQLIDDTEGGDDTTHEVWLQARRELAEARELKWKLEPSPCGREGHLVIHWVRPMRDAPFCKLCAREAAVREETINRCAKIAKSCNAACLVCNTADLIESSIRALATTDAPKGEK